MRLSLLIFLLLTSALSAGPAARATEFLAYGGALTHSAAGGCCQSTGTKPGGGVLGRFELKPFGEVDLLAYSDGRWSEGIIAKPYYLMGAPNRADTGAGEMVEAVTVSNWRWISSFGAGFFTHTSRRKKFDLPILISGLVFSNINQFMYAVNDRWSAGGILQLSFAISASDTSALVGTYFGVAYNFK